MYLTTVLLNFKNGRTGRVRRIIFQKELGQALEKESNIRKYYGKSSWSHPLNRDSNNVDCCCADCSLGEDAPVLVLISKSSSVLTRSSPGRNFSRPAASLSVQYWHSFVQRLYRISLFGSLNFLLLQSLICQFFTDQTAHVPYCTYIQHFSCHHSWIKLFKHNLNYIHLPIITSRATVNLFWSTGIFILYFGNASASMTLMTTCPRGFRA